MINMTLSERVFEILRDRILTGVYKPGDRLLYASLSEEMDVSLSPVKEALLLLAQDGLVTMIPRRGAYVSQVSIRDVVEYTWIRYSLECLACELICAQDINPSDFEQLLIYNERLGQYMENGNINRSMQMDNEFHMHLVNMSGNQRLIETVKKLPLANLSIVAGSENYILNNRDTIYRTHADIAAALKENDLERAKSHLKENIILPLEEILP